MKKIYLFFAIIGMLTFNNTSAQQAYYKAPQGTNTTTVRGPNGSAAHAFLRGCYIVPASELTGIATVTAINGFGFNLVGGTASTAVTGTIQVYLQNTSDVTYLKGTNWSNALTGMTSVYNNTMTIPTGSTLAQAVNVLFPSNFTYTGGGLYVAYDWASTGPFETSPTVANYQCQTNINQGGASNSSASAPSPTAILNTNFRPNFNFGYINTFTNEAMFVNVISAGKIPITAFAPYTYSAVIKNMANTTMTNVVVDLLMNGANTFTTTTTVPTIASGATTTVTFPAFTPTAQGTSTITISCANDQNNLNNTGSTTQSVTCEVWALGQPSTATNSYSLGVGFQTGSGSIITRFRPNTQSTVVAVDLAISSDVSNIGKPVYGIITNSAGTLLGLTNTVVLTNAHLNKFTTFFFPTPITTSANTNYHIGLVQPTFPHFPMGASTATYIPPNSYFQSGVTGGFLISLTQNLGIFGIEPIFANGITLTVNSATICSGNSVTLTANSSVSNYTWSTGATTNSIVVAPNTTTMYVVNTNSSNICFSKKPAFVTVNITPTITVPNGGICPTPGSYTFTPSGASTYTYSSGSNTVAPTVTTIYTVVGSSTAGCISAPVTPTVFVGNSVTLAIVSPTGICTGSSATLIGTGAASYSWSTSSTLNPIVVNPTVSTTYGVLGTVGTCTNFVSTLLMVNQNPTISVVATKTLYCAGAPASTLTASGAASYSWNTGANTATIAVTPTNVITYSVMGFDVNGCTDSKLLTIGIAGSPTVNATTSSPTICINETATLTATGGLAYVWSNNTSTTNIAVISPTATTVYTVTGSDFNGCTNSYTLTQFVDPCAGIKEINGVLVKTNVYPNPHNGTFNLSISVLSEKTRMEVYNSIGQLVFDQDITSNTTTINMNEMANGVYLIKIKSNNQVIDNIRVIKN